MEKINKSDIIPTVEDKRRDWMENLALKITGYATLLGISDHDRDKALLYYKAYNYAVKSTTGYIDGYKSGTNKWKARMLREDKIPGPPMGQFPVFVTLGLPPPEVAPGMLKFIEGIIETCILSGNLTVVIAEDLWFIPVVPVIDWNMIPLVLSNRIGTAGVNEIGFKLKGANGVAMFVNRNDGLGWVFMYNVTVVPFVDTTTYPAGTNTTYKYKGIRFVGTGKNITRVGQYSNEVILPVNNG